MDLTDCKSTLVQVMAWCRQATSHCLSQCWPIFMSPYGVTRPQWVKNQMWPQYVTYNNMDIILNNMYWMEWLTLEVLFETWPQPRPQLERLGPETPPTATWLPILVTHIRSQVKTRQSQSYKRLPKVKILKFCKKLYMWHTFWSYLIRCINMKRIQPEL